MSDNTRERVTLPLTIDTHYFAGNKREADSIRVERISHYICSLFYFVRKTIEGHSLLDISTDQKLIDWPAEFFGELEVLCHLGEGLSEQITLYTNDRGEEPKPEAETWTVKVGEKESPDDKETIQVSELLAAVMRSPACPARLYNVIADELTYVNPELTPGVIIDAINDMRSREQTTHGLAETVLDVKSCAVCGEDHAGVVFSPIDRDEVALGGFSHVGMCPNKRLQIFSKEVSE